MLMLAAHTSSPRDRRGGARNSASRETWRLKSEQIENVAAAAGHALCLGLPLTRLITVHWKAAGIALERMVQATGHFLDIATKWLRRQGSATAWSYVHENGDAEGWHSHILLHVPAELAVLLVRRQRSWITRVCEATYTKGTIKGRIVGSRLGIERSHPELYQRNLDRCVAYIVKQTSLAAARQHGLTRTAQPGLVIGKRAGTSENIGPTARQSCRSAGCNRCVGHRVQVTSPLPTITPDWLQERRQRCGEWPERLPS